MPYIQIDDFRLGVDRRRSRVAGPRGSLWSLVNAHITRGGEIERCKAFVPAYTLPAGATVGAFALNGQIVVFGHASGVTVPVGVVYQRLVHPSSPSMPILEILGADEFDRRVYVVARFLDGSVHHYFDGVRVSAWDALSASNGSMLGVANAMAALIDAQDDFASVVVGHTALSSSITVTAAVPGVPFTITARGYNNGTDNDNSARVSVVQANVPAAAEVRATGGFRVIGGTANPGVNRITSVRVDGIEVLGVAVNWATSNADTAQAVVTQINVFGSGYTATRDGRVIIISPPVGQGAAANGSAVVVTLGGDVVIDQVRSLTGGLDATTAVAQVARVDMFGNLEQSDAYQVVLNGIPFIVTGQTAGVGTSAMTYRSKVYSILDTALYYSALNKPRQWGAGIGAGYNGMSGYAGGALTAVAEYQGLLAVFTADRILLWTFSEDQTRNAYAQTLRSSGTRSPRSVVSVGSNDVFYLDAASGIRSIRPRGVNDTASVQDVGTAIDSLVAEHIESVAGNAVESAVGVIEPVDGRYWLAIGDRIFVLSQFPSSKISAWSYYAPGFAIQQFVRLGTRLYARSGDTIHLYGGPSGDTYPAAGQMPVEVALPFLSADTPATPKQFRSFDLAGSGAWRVRLLADPNRDDSEVDVGVVDRTTYLDGSVGAEFISTHVAARLTCDSAGPAVLTSMAFHYDAGPAA